MAIPQPQKGDRKADRVESLTHRLESLEQQLARLSDLLSEQAAAKVRRRRQFTIRFMLAAFVFFACFFAWFGNVYHQSRRQAAAVDDLISESVFVMYAPRESPLISLMPGPLEQPPATLVKWLGDDFFRAVTNVSTATSGSIPLDKGKLITSINSLTQLKRLRLTRLSLKTSDLAKLELDELQSLDISRTGLDSGAMPWVRNTQLRWLDAAHTKLSDRALLDLSQCDDLQHLNLERTAISDNGLLQLQGMSQLRYLNLKRSPVSAAAVKKLSAALPNCVIEWEPLKFSAGGKVDAGAAARGRMRLGRRNITDPRTSRRAVAPHDKVPRYVPWTEVQYDQYYPRLQLDVF